jgi:hypothetical protein
VAQGNESHILVLLVMPTPHKMSGILPGILPGIRYSGATILPGPLRAGKMARCFCRACKLLAHNDLLAKSVLPGELRFGKMLLH